MLHASICQSVKYHGSQIVGKTLLYVYNDNKIFVEPLLFDFSIVGNHRQIIT